MHACEYTTVLLIAPEQETPPHPPLSIDSIGHYCASHHTTHMPLSLHLQETSKTYKDQAKQDKHTRPTWCGHGHVCVWVVTFVIVTDSLKMHAFDGYCVNGFHTNTKQYNTIQYNTIQYNTIQYNTIEYSTIQYNTIHTSR